MIGRFVIFGDSYSTHKDHIPKGYAHYYCDEGRAPDQPVTRMTAAQTWWGRLIEKTGATLVLNDSWSGSTIGYTGYAGDCSSSSSFIYRYRRLWETGFFKENPVDTIFVFGGTNDSWSNAPLGAEQYSDFSESDLYNVINAICYFMITLKTNHPGTRVVFIANCGIKNEILDAMRSASQRTGVELVELCDIDKIAAHPTARGMKEICYQVIANLGEG